MVHNNFSSYRERGQFETINLLNLLIWMGKFTRIQFETWAVIEEISYLYSRLLIRCEF